LELIFCISNPGQHLLRGPEQYRPRRELAWLPLTTDDLLLAGARWRETLSQTRHGGLDGAQQAILLEKPSKFPRRHFLRHPPSFTGGAFSPRTNHNCQVPAEQSRAEQSRTPPPSPSPSPSGPDQLLRYYHSSSPRAPLPFYGPPAVLETCRCRCRTLVFAYRGCRRDLFVPVAKRRHHLCAVNSVQYQREKVKRISIDARFCS
jgi:hypothetical protein